jgi:type IV pilus assembly protein PilW
MKRRMQPSRRGRSRGLTLVELMVAMTIGLVIVLATIGAYIGSAGAGRMAEAQGRMNEDAQAALAILAQQLKMAGNNPNQPNRVEDSRRNPVYAPIGGGMTTTFTPTAFAIRGCDGTFSNIGTATDLDALTCVSSTTTLPDSIGVNYEADRYNTIPTAAGVPTDCTGNALTTVTATVTATNAAGTGTLTVNVPYYVADSRFYIGTSAAVVSPSLYCKGNGGAAQPLVENIENLQLTYGTVPAGATSTSVNIAGYISAHGMLNEATLAALASDADRWGKAVAVRVCVVVRSEQPVVSDADSARYLKCDGTIETNPPDLRLRRAYSTTVVLRNRL